VYLRRAAGRGGDEAAEEHLAHSARREVDAAQRALVRVRVRVRVTVRVKVRVRVIGLG
jgi:hypothetical protein